MFQRHWICCFLTFLHLRVHVIVLLRWVLARFSVLLFTQNQRQQISVFVIGVDDRTHGELVQKAVLEVEGKCVNNIY